MPAISGGSTKESTQPPADRSIRPEACLPTTPLFGANLCRYYAAGAGVGSAGATCGLYSQRCPRHWALGGGEQPDDRPSAGTDTAGRRRPQPAGRAVGAAP